MHGPAKAPARKPNGPHERPVHGSRISATAARPYSFAAFLSSSALSVFSHEKAVAVCFLPAPST